MKQKFRIHARENTKSMLPLLRLEYNYSRKHIKLSQSHDSFLKYLR